MRIAITFVFIIGLYFNALSQPWLLNDGNTLAREEVTFNQIKASFDSWAEGKDVYSYKGIKRYKRWEWFMYPRTYPEGNFPDPAVNWKEWMLEQANHEKSLKDNANWTSLSPNEVPPSLDTASIHGMGRINCIEFHPTDTNIIYVGASQGGVWKSTDEGQTWICLTDDLPVLRVSSIAIDHSNPDIIYIATGDIDYVDFPTIDYGRMTQYGIGILKSTDGGISWNTTGLSFELTEENNSLIRKIAVQKSNSQNVIAAGPCGVYTSINGGDSWTKQSSEKVIDLEVNPLNDNVLYMSTLFNSQNASSKRIYRSDDFGQTWRQLQTGLPATAAYARIELALAPSDTSVIYAMICKSSSGGEGLRGIYRSTNSGESWSLIYDDYNMLGWFDGTYVTDRFYTENQTMLQFAGVTRDQVNMDTAGQGTYDLTLIVDPFNAAKVYSGGVNMWGSVDSGATWNIVSLWVGTFGASIHADQHNSAFNPTTGRFFQVNDGGIYKTSEIQMGNLDEIYDCIDWNALIQSFIQGNPVDDVSQFIKPSCTYRLPTEWDDISGGIHNTEYYRFASCRTNPDMIVGGAQDNGTYKYRNGEWINTYGGDGMEAMIDHYNDSIYYVTNYNGALSKTVDGGVTFESSLEGPIAQTETGDWVTPFVMHPQYSDTIYTAFQNVWVSGDGGHNWSKLSDNSTSYSYRALAVAPSNTNYIYAYRPGNLMRTKNRGTTWEMVNNGLPSNMITYIAVDDNNPEKIWVTLSGYSDGMKVFESSDAGDSWTNISGNLPNVSANCIVFQDSTSIAPVRGIYIGTDIGVYYTNEALAADTSGRWIKHSFGLPNVIVNELEISYGAGKLRAATYGRGFWETDLVVPSTGVTKPALESNVTVFPNPTHKMFNVNASFPSADKITIMVFDLQGRIIYRNTQNDKTTISQSIDMGNFPSGTYLVQVVYKNAHYTSKLIKN